MLLLFIIIPPLFFIIPSFISSFFQLFLLLSSKSFIHSLIHKKIISRRFFVLLLLLFFLLSSLLIFLLCGYSHVRYGCRFHGEEATTSGKSKRRTFDNDGAMLRYAAALRGSFLSASPLYGCTSSEEGGDVVERRFTQGHCRQFIVDWRGICAKHERKVLLLLQ